METATTSDDSAEFLAAYRKNVTLLDARTAMLRQPGGPLNEARILALFDEVARLMRDPGCEYLIVDLTDADRPNAKNRALLTHHGQMIRDLKHVAVFTGRNALMNVVAKFLLSPIYRSYSVHKTREQAEEAISRVAD